MWEDNEVEEGEDDDEDEDEGLAGQLLSDLIASNKYGTSRTFHSVWLLVLSALGFYCYATAATQQL